MRFIFFTGVGSDEDIFGDMMPDHAALAIDQRGDRAFEGIALDDFDARVEPEAPVEHVLKHLRVVGLEARNRRLDAGRQVGQRQ